MSPLEWALALQAIYFFGFHFLEYDGKSITKYQMSDLNNNPAHFLFASILGQLPSLPLLFTLLLLVLYPTPLVFIWLVVNVLFWFIVGIEEKIPNMIIASIIGFVVFLINWKLAVLTEDNPKLIYPTTTTSSSSTLTQTSSDNGLWFLPLKVLIALASVIGVLLLLRWAIKEFLPNLNSSMVLEKVIITVVSGVVVTSFAYWFFGDPTVATVPGLAAAAGLYLLNRQG